VPYELVIKNGFVVDGAGYDYLSANSEIVTEAEKETGRRLNSKDWS